MPRSIVTTFMLPEELASVDEAERYISLCKKRRAEYAALPGAPQKRTVDLRWQNRIEAAEVRLTALQSANDVKYPT